MQAFRYWLLAVLLLGAQFALVVHATDLEAHAYSSDSACEVCLHSSALDTGLLGEPVTLAVIAATDGACLLPFTAPAVIQPFGFDARGPPILSA